METVFSLVLCLMMSESCNVFKSMDHLTLDTSVCLFQNFTEPVSKWICLQFCKNYPACTGVLRKQDEPIYWCCLVTEREIQYKKPAEMILYYKNDTSVKCLTGWSGRNCDACAPHFGPPGQCDQCLRGWTGKNCTECTGNFGPVGQCDRCVNGWGGENCDICAQGWTGGNCTECATNFGPVGQCDRCLLGWAGNHCDVCDFGFSTESNCTECIQNGKWTGTYGQNHASMKAFLSFEGAACNNLEPGTTVTYNGFNRQVTSGNYDNTSGTLTVMEHYYNPVGSINVANKRIIGSIVGFPYRLNYQG